MHFTYLQRLMWYMLYFYSLFIKEKKYYEVELTHNNKKDEIYSVIESKIKMMENLYMLMKMKIKSMKRILAILKKESQE